MLLCEVFEKKFVRLGMLLFDVFEKRMSKKSLNAGCVQLTRTCMGVGCACAEIFEMYKE